MRGLKMFLLVFLIISVEALASTAEVAVITVEVPINGKSEFEVRSEGKLKAVKKGIDRLPFLVEGKETLVNGRYEEEIKAASYSYVDVETISEQWDRAKNTFTLQASVKLDVEKSFRLVNQLADKKRELARLRSLYNQLNTSIKKQMDEADVTKAMAQFKSLQLNAALGGSLSDIIEQKKDYVASYKRKYTDIVKRVAETIEIAVEDVDDTHVQFIVTAINAKDSMQLLDSQYDNLDFEYSIARVCGFSDTGLHFVYDVNPVVRYQLKGLRLTMSGRKVSDYGNTVKFRFKFKHDGKSFTYAS
jgi:hypothetical protein